MTNKEALVHLVPFYPIPVPPKEDFFKIGVETGGGKIYSAKGKKARSIARAIFRKTVHAHGRGFPFPEAAGLFAKKSVYTPHNDFIGSQWLTRHVRRALFNQFDVITVQTQYGKRMFRKQGIKTKIIVMPTPVDYDFFSAKDKALGKKLRKKYGLSKDKFAIAIGIRPVKNPDVIAKACKQAGLRLVMLGAKSEKELKKAWASSKGFEWFLPPKGLKESKQVVLPGQLSPKEVRALLGEASIFINSSEYECFGLVAYEAAAAGVPLCLPKYGAFEIFKHSALFHSAQSSNELAVNIKKYMKKPSLARANSAKARKIAKKYNYPTVKKKWIKFYKRFLN